MILNPICKLNAAHILMVEDDPDDVELTKRAIREKKLAIRLDVVENGEDALKYLNKEAPYEECTTPDLVLLDLNLPRVDGRTVLKKIRETESLSGLPVIVLTTSNSEEDIKKCYDLNVNCYIPKPVGIKELEEVVYKIEDFWFSVVKLPKF